MTYTVSRQTGRMMAGLTVFVVLLCLGSLMLGRYPIDPVTAVWAVIAKFIPVSTDFPPTLQTVLFHVRLPRIGAALLIGGGLAMSGASFQGLFRNPLVSPFILGVASGAGFGAALGILLSAGMFGIQLLAFVFGALAVLLSYGMGRVYKAAPTLVLVLSGVIVGSFFSALLSLLKYVADPYDKLPVIVYWLMGSLATMTQAKLFSVCVPILLGIAVLMVVRWRINVLTLGDEEAKALGVSTGRLRLVIVLAATLITASAVSVSGIIGWVGLVIPHLARMLVGPNYSRLMPASLLLGACYMLLIDDVARTVTASEIPLGILTATIGAPVFAFLLRKGRLGWA
ncbi:FecCD family ABC transporter permease [Desulfovibrio inopinatus]|uniref:FecCD family ABC transporter permease n=1 Tax=Desulfovibrio inopinatus TaxID=102109 RepID=UPI00041C65A2|nr:iron ABC transporter permease [Desulfovibrio inopinatus]